MSLPNSNPGATAATSSTGSEQPNPPPDLKAQLEELKESVKEDQDQIAQKTKEITGLQQDITVLESGLGEIDQTVKAYTQALEAAGDLSRLQSSIDHEKSMATAAVGAGKTDLDKIVKDYDEKVIDELTKKVVGKKADSDNDAGKYAVAQNSAKEKQAQYDDLKANVSRMAAWVAEVRNLKTQANSASDRGTFGVMYFLVGEMQFFATKIEVNPNPDELRKKLNDALAAVQLAKKTLRDRKEASDKALAELLAAQKELNDAKAGRRATLTDRLKNWQPPPPPSATTKPTPIAAKG
jgi:hypothetical protein